MGGGTTRERGRPARMHSGCVLLRFPAMCRPATLTAGTAWALSKQSPDAVAGRAGWRSWSRLCQDVCGRDARAPGWASFHDVVAANGVHRSLGPFVDRQLGRTPLCLPLVVTPQWVSNRGGTLRKTVSCSGAPRLPGSGGVW